MRRVHTDGEAPCAAPSPATDEHSTSNRVAQCAQRDVTINWTCRDDKDEGGVISFRKRRAERVSQDSPVAIAPTHLLDSYLSLNWESSGPMCGEAHRTRVEVNSGRVRREHLRRREQNLYEPGSSPGKIPGGRHGARRARLLADRTRNRSQKFPVPVPNGSRPLHHPDRSFLPSGKACNAWA